MHPSFLAIDVTILRTPYIDQRLTIDRIGRELGCGASTVSRRLRRFGVSVRRRGPDPGATGKSPRAYRSRGGPTSPGSSDSSQRMGTSLGSRARFGSSPTTSNCWTLSVAASLSEHRFGARAAAGGNAAITSPGDRTLYEWLIDIGLTPAKSLTLGPIAVPDQYFRDFFRGCIDGDGSVLTYIDRYHTVKNADGRLYVSLVSASHGFVERMLATLRRLLSVSQNEIRSESSVGCITRRMLRASVGSASRPSVSFPASTRVS